MHRGHAFSAILAHDAARAAGGRFLLRIEDIDKDRCRPEFTDAIVEDLTWLGLDWDGPIIRQSERMTLYAAALDELNRQGLLYRCFRTRAEVAAAIGQAPHEKVASYFGSPLSKSDETERMAAGESFAWRLSIAAAEAALGGFSGLSFFDAELGEVSADPWAIGDVILARKDLGVAYHLAAVIDDAAFDVSLVVRGEDLREACHTQRLLQALLGLPTPAYRHHRLILAPDGKRLAKRDKSETLRALRTAGVTPAQIRTGLGLPI